MLCYFFILSCMIFYFIREIELHRLYLTAVAYEEHLMNITKSFINLTENQIFVIKCIVKYSSYKIFYHDN